MDPTQLDNSTGGFPGTAFTPEQCLSAAPSLKDKVIVVTGAGGGFGRAFSILAASHGAKIVASDQNLAPVLELVQEIKEAGGSAIGVQCDVTNWDAQVAMFRRGVDEFKVIDIVVPNAGVPEIPGWLTDTVGPDNELKKPSFLAIDVNITGALYTSRIGLHHLRNNPRPTGKSIVLLGSMSSFFGIPLAPMYTTSKHAQLGFFRSMYHSLRHEGVTVNIVCPWFVLTPILKVPARLAIAGLPTATVERVVEGMIKAASDEKSDGLIFSIDPTGVLAIDYDSFTIGDSGYYHTFVQRAQYTISTARTIKDSLRAIKSGLPPHVQRNLVVAAGVATVALVVGLKLV